MPKTNDKSADPKDWTNRKLIATIREGVNWHSTVMTHASRALDELERRTVRSSSRN